MRLIISWPMIWTAIVDRKNPAFFISTVSVVVSVTVTATDMESKTVD